MVRLLLPFDEEGVPELGPFGPLVTPLLGGVLPIVEAEVIELGMDVVA